MLEVDDVINAYERLYRQVYNQPNFVFNFTEQRKQVLKKFLSSIPFSAGKNWIHEYLLFQFFRYSSQSKKFHAIKNINWVFGSKAYTAWTARTPEQLYHCQIFKYKFQIKIDDFAINSKSLVYVTAERKRFFNTLQGYAHCKNLNLTYEVNSTCLLCQFKNWCVQEKSISDV